VVIDHKGKEAPMMITAKSLSRDPSEHDAHALLDEPEVREDLLPSMLETATEIAKQRVVTIVADARKEMNAQLAHEISRLKQLRKVNRSVRVEEIELLAAQQHALEHHLSAARLRLDAVRLISG